MIRSFAGREAEKIWRGFATSRLPVEIANKALSKLRLLDSAIRIDELRIPPGNRLERLKGDRSGQHSIRINDQWRICFTWKEGSCHDVEIVDYHR